MSKDIAGSITHVPEASARVVFHKFEDQVSCVGVECGPFDTGWTFGDLFVENNRVGLGFVEGREPRKHFKDEDAECIPINGFIVPRIGNNLSPYCQLKVIVET